MEEVEYLLRITQDGEIVQPSILGDEHPLDMYYGYGIRNSFGITSDPVTGNLWDTETMSSSQPYLVEQNIYPL
jgi:glucose/arabinose dehydrogenase